MSRTQHFLLFLSILVLLASILVLTSPPPVHSQEGDNSSTPTPLSQPRPKRNGQSIQSGETQGMIIGASFIVLIIIFGLILQGSPSRQAPASEGDRTQSSTPPD